MIYSLSSDEDRSPFWSRVQGLGLGFRTLGLLELLVFVCSVPKRLVFTAALTAALELESFPMQGPLGALAGF